MFIATELQMAEHTSLESYAKNLSCDLPSGIQLHAQILDPISGHCRCIWEVDSIESLRQYIEPTANSSAKCRYFEIDPIRAIY
ncbi:TPA: hypothetical protein ACX6Q1_001509 [Photobacterium damselae]